jgi:hypothetical protein
MSSLPDLIRHSILLAKKKMDARVSPRVTTVWEDGRIKPARDG